MMEEALLISYLECPVCLTVPRSRIFYCINSHKICAPCYMKMAQDLRGNKLCPQGGCKFDKPPRRARDCEAMIENSDLDVSCIRPGCIVEMKKEEILQHEVGCIFRTVPCPRTDCQKRVLFKDIDFHIEEKHQLKVKKNSRITQYLEENSFHLMDGDWPRNGIYYHEQDGEQFYPQIVKRNGIWYFWVKIKGSPLVAAKWKFQVKLESVINQISVEFSGLVHSVDKSVIEILETGQYLPVNRQWVQQLREMLPSEVNGYSSSIVIPFKISNV